MTQLFSITVLRFILFMNDVKMAFLILNTTERDIELGMHK